MANERKNTKIDASKDEVTDNRSSKIVRSTRIVPALKNRNLATNPAGGFLEFLREQSVVGLAIGLVLGTQAKALVDQIMLSFISPLTGLLLPGEGTLKQKIFTVHISHKTAAFGWGAFVSSLLTFIIVAALVYYVFKGLGLDKLDKKKEG